MFLVISKCIHVLSLHGIFCFSSWPRKPMMSFRKTEKKGKERGKGNTCIHVACRFSRHLIAIHKIIQFSHIIHILISINQIQFQVQWQWSMLHQNDRTVGHACNAQSQSLIPYSSLIISTTNKSKHAHVHDINTAKHSLRSWKNEESLKSNEFKQKPQICKDIRGEIINHF